MKPSLSSLQAVAIVVNTILPTGFLLLPSYIIQISKQDGWISLLLSVAAALFFAFAIGSIARQNDQSSLLAWLEVRFGKVITTVIGLFLCGYYLIVAATTMRFFSNFLSEQMLYSTPLFMLAAIIALVGIYMSSQGIPTLGNVHFIVLVLVLIFMGINAFLLWKQFDIKQFLPMFEATLVHHLAAGILPISWLSEISVLLLFVPFLKNKEAAVKIAVWGTLISGILITLITAVTLAVFGKTIISIFTYPAFEMVSTVEFGNFVERVDVLLLSAWMASMFAKVSVFMFCFFHLVTQTFKVTSHMSLYIAGGLLIMATSLYSWPSNILMVRYSYTTLNFFLLFSNYGICLFIWCGLLFTRHKGKTEGA